jgi:hypothetical protein
METPQQRLTRLASRQYGCFSRTQALHAGFTEHQLRSSVERHLIEPLGPHAFRIAGVPSDRRGEVMGLLLDVGHGARASGPTAAALHGFDGYRLRPPFHLTTPRGIQLTRPGHRVHTTHDLPLIDRATIDRIAVTSAARTLIDLARTESVEQLTIAFDSGLRDGKFNESLLHRRIVALRGSGRNGVRRLLRAIDGAEVVAGGHSWLEREFLRLVASAGLPRPQTQVVLSRARDRLVRVDIRFPGTPVIVELLGYRFHRSPDQLRRDAERLNALVLDGFLPMQFTYEQVVNEPDALLADLTRLLHVWKSAS